MTHSLTNDAHASDCSVPPSNDIAYGNNQYHGVKWAGDEERERSRLRRVWEGCEWGRFISAREVPNRLNADQFWVKEKRMLKCYRPSTSYMNKSTLCSLKSFKYGEEVQKPKQITRIMNKCLAQWNKEEEEKEEVEKVATSCIMEILWRKIHTDRWLYVSYFN